MLRKASIRLQDASQGFNKVSGCFAGQHPGTRKDHQAGAEVFWVVVLLGGKTAVGKVSPAGW